MLDLRLQRYDFFPYLLHFARNYFFQYEFRRVAVAENLWKRGRCVAFELLPGLPDAAFVGIGEDGVARIDDFHPFGLRPQNDAGLFEEIGLLLHPARVGDDQSGMAFQGGHLQEGCGRDDLV